MALGRRALERALRIDALHPNDREALLAHAQALPRGEGTAGGGAAPMPQG
jgi:hypothetical protein